MQQGLKTKDTVKLLYVGMLYDYGDPSRGLSFEERNFFHPLHWFAKARDWKVIRFDFMQLCRQHGRQQMSEMLWDVVKRERPSYLVAILFNPEHDPSGDVIRRITFETDTTTINWFCDDHWRFDNYSQFVAPHFTWAITTDSAALLKYQNIGMAGRVIKSQWACNHRLYRPIDCRRDMEVSFVGQPHGNRAEIVQQLSRANINLRVFGYGWSGAPRLPFHEMVRVFSRSRINLNLSNSSVADMPQQIKGRNFEIPGSRGFQLTSAADNLEEYYVNGKEVVIFHSPEDLTERIRYYLQHDTEREAIATASHERTLKEHTWETRWSDIFGRFRQPRQGSAA